jgi:hypothetical protein
MPEANLNQKLQALRIKWKNHPELRSVIERQAKALKYSQSVKVSKDKQVSEKFVADVLDNLLE